MAIMQRAPLLLMGVAGSGKTVVGRLLAEVTSATFLDGDDFHPPENTAKMGLGTPLADADRAGWLNVIAAALTSHDLRAGPVIVACSALKLRYRNVLRASSPSLLIVHLDVSSRQAERRVATRRGHFMPPELVASQIATLEPPEGEPGVLTVDAVRALADLIDDIEAWWAAAPLVAAKSPGPA